MIILLFLILNFFGSENLNSDYIQPTEENVKLFNSYFENPEIIDSRNFVKNSFQNWSNSYFKDFDLKKILKYGEENENEDPNSYTKKKALVDLDFIKDTIEENHGARLVLDRWFFDQLDKLIEIAKNKILNSKNKDERLNIIDECIEPLEDKISKKIGGHFYIKINRFYREKYKKNDIEKNLLDKDFSNLNKFQLIPYIKNNNLYIRIPKFSDEEYFLKRLKKLELIINKFFNKMFFPVKNIIFDLRDNSGGDASIINKILNIFFKHQKKYEYKAYLKFDKHFGIVNNFLTGNLKKNNNLTESFNIDIAYKNNIDNIKKYLSNNFIVLMDNMTYSASLSFIKNLKQRIKDNNNNKLILIGDKTNKGTDYAGYIKNFTFPSEFGSIIIPFRKIEQENYPIKDYYSKYFIPDIYRNYYHIDNPDDLIDQIVADVEAYKNGFKFSNKENAHQFKIDNFKQPIDDDKFVVPSKKYYPKL